MKVHFIQSCDPRIYIRMVNHTMPTVLEYCEKWDCTFDFFVGVRKGAKPWHAALNRVFVLKDLVNEKFDGWVIHLDADAFIFDVGFDVRHYLAEREKYALIAAPSGVQPPHWWDINNGVFAINLSDRRGVEIVDDWHARIAALDDDLLRAEARWADVVDDQNQLHLALESKPHLEPFVLHDVMNFNGGARFIRQVLRAEGDMDKRIEIIARTLAHRGRVGRTDPDREAIYDDAVKSFYRVLLGREPDPGGYQASIENLISGRRRIEDELRACVASDEFKLNLERLAKGPAGI